MSSLGNRVSIVLMSIPVASISTDTLRTLYEKKVNKEKKRKKKKNEYKYMICYASLCRINLRLKRPRHSYKKCYFSIVF